MTDVVTAVSLPLGDELPSENPLGGTMLRGLVWLGGARWVAQLFTWACTLLIARLLKPEDYGLLTMATVLTGFVEFITDLGLGSALVQEPNLTKRDVEATMGATCLLGVVAAALIVAGAPLWAKVQGDARVVPIMQVLAFGVIVTTAGNVPYSMLHRRLAFGLAARAQFVRGIVTAAVTLGAAFVLQSHWALVVGFVTGKIAFTVMLFWAEPIAIRLPGRSTHIRRLLRFGGMLTADRILNYLRANTDVALVGALLGSRMVGLYVMATALARLPFEKLGSALEPVAYPTFARLRGDTAQQRHYFRLLSLGTVAFALPMCLGLIVTAAVLVPAVIGAQWTAVVRPLQVAAIVTPLVFHVSLISALFNANGRVDLNLRITTLMATSTIAAVLIGVRFGIVGVAAASGIAFAGVWVYAALLGLQMLELHWKDIAHTLYPAVSASLGMAACAYAVSLALPTGWPPLGRLVIECLVGASTYVAWGFLLHSNTVIPHLRSLRTAWSAR